MSNRQCKSCDKTKSIDNYDGESKRHKSYHYCRECIDAKLIKCNLCNISKKHTEYRRDSSAGTYLGRKARCTECLKEKDKVYTNSEENVARQKAYFKQYYEDNKEKLLARDAAFKLANRAMYTANGARRRAAKARATGPWTNNKEINAIYAKARRIQEDTGIEHHVDHIVPLQSDKVCGLHIACNLQVLKATDNMSKSNSFDVQ